MKVTYTIKGDYLLPDLTIKKQDYKQINKYGYLRLDYIENHKKGLYTTLLMKNELINHLLSVSIECSKRYNVLMYNYKNTAEEIVLNEYVFI